MPTLAEYYRRNAMVAGEDRDVHLAAVAECARHLYAAPAYPGDLADRTMNQTVLEAMHAAAQLIVGAAWTSDELAKLFTSLSAEFEKVRLQVEPPRGTR